ncbi:MAG: BCAM0308 family protein [Desulfuromonadales bacterium]|nr:BCAM0308 family protein [Desulfuromonadales bacterium]MDT8423250.1 BCAM0308 family protein [Desulfuromonadales bacterium]
MNGKNGGVHRQDRLLKEQTHDPYLTRSKLKEPTLCPACNVVFSGGRWQWPSEIPAAAYSTLCPACKRTRDNHPAGILTLSGRFFAGHHAEILNLINNKVEGQKAQHPMKRLMTIDEQEDGKTVITFTDTHLPRGVGQAIENAHGGTLDIHYTAEADVVRVFWER